MSFHYLAHPKHYIVGQTYVKELRLELAGDKVNSHAHLFDHLSLLATGRVAVTVNGKRIEYEAPTAVTILANQRHEIEALCNDCLWYCIHSVPEDLRGEELLDSVLVSHS